jgi:hypothetical protein
MEPLRQLCLETYESTCQLCLKAYESVRRKSLEKYESLRQLGLKTYLPYYDIRTEKEYNQEVSDAEHGIEYYSKKEHESFRKHSKLVSRRICRISFDGDEFSIESNPK